MQNLTTSESQKQLRYDLAYLKMASSWAELSHCVRKKVGAIIERPNFYPYMTAEDNLKLVCKIKDIPYTKVYEKLELGDYLFNIFISTEIR